MNTSPTVPFRYVPLITQADTGPTAQDSELAEKVAPSWLIVVSNRLSTPGPVIRTRPTCRATSASNVNVSPRTTALASGWHGPLAHCGARLDPAGGGSSTGPAGRCRVARAPAR